MDIFLLLHQYGLHYLVYQETGNCGKCSFGAEFVAMKQAMEVSRRLQYKLRMLGVPIEGPTHMYGDNMSMIHNTPHPESQLKKKSNSICYQVVGEAVAMEGRAVNCTCQDR